MSVNVRLGPADAGVAAIAATLGRYADDHPAAQVEVYRYSPASVRVRIIDPTFAAVARPRRVQTVWAYLESLPETVHADISTLLLLAPDEVDQSVANAVFEHPVPLDLV